MPFEENCQLIMVFASKYRFIFQYKFGKKLDGDKPVKINEYAFNQMGKFFF